MYVYIYIYICTHTYYTLVPARPFRAPVLLQPFRSR